MMKFNANAFDECVNAATDEKLTKEDWSLMNAVCEKVFKAGDQGSKDCIASIQKRLIHRNANVQLYALTLTNYLVKECGLSLHREICSRAFISVLTKILNDRNTYDAVKNRILDLIQEWSNEFRSNPSLSLMEETRRQLQLQNFQFPPQKPQKDPSEVEADKRRKKEDDDYKLALRLSLAENSDKKPTQSVKSLHSSNPSTQDKGLPQAPSVTRVRALYDFHPTESNELGFSCGDIINVIDNVYKDWWKGELRGKTGIFPVNYVEKITEPTPADIQKELEMEVNVFSQSKNIERLLELLEGFDAQKDSFTTNDDIQNLYNVTLPIRPKLTILVEKYTKKKDYLIELHTKFVKAISTYEQLMNDSFMRYTNPHQVNPAYITPQGYVPQNSTFIGYPNAPQQIYNAPNQMDSTAPFNQPTDQQSNVYQSQQQSQFYPHQNGYASNQQPQYGSQVPQQQYQQAQYINQQDPTQQMPQPPPQQQQYAQQIPQQQQQYAQPQQQQYSANDPNVQPQYAQDPQGQSVYQAQQIPQQQQQYAQPQQAQYSNNDPNVQTQYPQDPQGQSAYPPQQMPQQPQYAQPQQPQYSTNDPNAQTQYAQDPQGQPYQARPNYY